MVTTVCKAEKNMEDAIMKRALTFTMVLVFLCVGTMLFASGEQDSGSANLAEMTGADAASFTKFAVEEGATIVLSGWGDQTEQQIYKDAIVRFNKIYPDVIVDYQPIPADFQTKLKAMMAGGTAPDVFYVDDQLMTAFAVRRLHGGG